MSFSALVLVLQLARAQEVDPVPPVDPAADAPTDSAPAAPTDPADDAPIDGTVPALAPAMESAAALDHERSKYVWGGIGVPLVNYNTTDGLGFGAGFQIFDRTRGTEHGYRNMLTVDTFWTISGNYTSNFLQYERRGKHLFVLRAVYRRWADMLYVGNGGSDVSVRDDLADSAGNLVAGPSLLATGIFRVPRSPVQLWAQGYVRQTTVRAKPGGILDDRQAFGIDGGWYFDVSGGVAVQETDRWPMPERGVRFESSVRGGATWSSGRVAPLVGANVELMGWYPLVGEWLVLGGRSVFDKSWGERPFWEAEWLGGQLRDELAYEQMLTGYGRSRTRGDGVFANIVELRGKLGHVQHPVFDMGFYLSVFAESAFLFEGNKLGPHMPSVGVAPDILWQGAIELRPFLSWGWLSDTRGGERTPDLAVGISLLGPL